MNLDRIKAFNDFEGFLKELPEEVGEKILWKFDRLKKCCLYRDEYVETLEEPQKSWFKERLKNAITMNRIHDVCNDKDISRVLGEEYLSMNAFKSWDDDQKKENLKGIREHFKEIYEKNADKIVVLRAELGLPNPFEEFKPYSVPSE
jgi:hypothetical protein